MTIDQPENLLWWVIPGVLAGMPMPFIHPDRRLESGGKLGAYNDDLPVLHKSGVRAVVSLLNIPRDGLVYEPAGFSFCNLPIPDGFPPSPKQALAFLDFVEQQRQKRRPVAVHCHAGIGRTGTMLAVYFIGQGASADEAIRQVRSVEPAAIETSEQEFFLEQFARSFSWKPAKDQPGTKQARPRNPDSRR